MFLRLVVFLLCLPLLAAEADWSAVQRLKTGKRIGVIHGNLKRTEGSVTSVSDEGVTVEQTMIPKGEVLRVYTIGHTNRLTRTLIGVGAGVAVGVLLNETVGQRFRNEGQDYAAGIIGASVGVGAAVGALSGNGQTTVYRRP